MASSTTVKKPAPSTSSQAQPLRRQKSFLQFASELDQEGVAVVREMFSMCDLDHDGRVSPKELKKVMNDMHLVVSDAEFRALWKHLDANGDGQLTLDEFASFLEWMRAGVELRKSPPTAAAGKTTPAPAPAPAATPARPSSSSSRSLAEYARDVQENKRGEVEQLFALANRRPSQQLRLDDLAKILAELDVHASDDALATLFARLDANGDGAISINEFTAGMHRISSVLALADTHLTRDAPDLDAAMAELRQSNRLMAKYINHQAVQMLVMAEEAAAHAHWRKAQTLLECIDAPLLAELEARIGAITTSEFSVRHTRLVNDVRRGLGQ